jgi:hypothetical protein
MSGFAGPAKGRLLRRPTVTPLPQLKAAPATWRAFGLPDFDPTRANNEIDGCVPVDNVLTAVVGGIVSYGSQLRLEPAQAATERVKSSIIGGANVQNASWWHFFYPQVLPEVLVTHELTEMTRLPARPRDQKLWGQGYAACAALSWTPCCQLLRWSLGGFRVMFQSSAF